MHDTFVKASSLTDKDKKNLCREGAKSCDYAKKLEDKKAEATDLQKKLRLRQNATLMRS